MTCRPLLAALMALSLCGAVPGVWPPTPHPGGEFYVFGNDVGGQVVNGVTPRLGPPELVDADGKVTALPYAFSIKDHGTDREHLLDLRLPADLRPGKYTLAVKGPGYEPREITVGTPPTKETGKTARVKPEDGRPYDTFHRAARDAGPGGTVILGPGLYDLSDGVVVVRDVRVIGYGAILRCRNYSEVHLGRHAVLEGATIVGSGVRVATLAGGTLDRCRVVGDGAQVAGGGAVLRSEFEFATLFHGGNTFVRDCRFTGFGVNHPVHTFGASDCLFLQNVIDGRDRGFVASLNWGPLERCGYFRNAVRGVRFAQNGGECWLVEGNPSGRFAARDCVVVGLSASDSSGPLVGVFGVPAERLTFRRLVGENVQIYSRPFPAQKATGLRIYDSELPGLRIDGDWSLERVYRTDARPALLNQGRLQTPPEVTR